MFALIGARLAVSVTNSAQRASVKPDDSYVTISEAPAWEALERIAQFHPRFAHYTFREACGLPPVPKSGTVRKWLGAHAGSAASLLDVNLRTAPSLVFDLSVGSPFLGADPGAAEMGGTDGTNFRGIEEVPASRWASGDMTKRGYSTRRRSSPRIRQRRERQSNRRAAHRASRNRFVCAPAAAVYAPIEGVVHALANNTAALDYGPVVILRHATGDGQEFFTLYGHLSKIAQWAARGPARWRAARSLARIGAMQENGGWAPHLHFQIIMDLLDRGRDFPGVARRIRARCVDESLARSESAAVASRASAAAAGHQHAAETLAARRNAARPKSQHFVSAAAENRARMEAISLRRHRPGVSRCLQQRAASGAQSSARGARGAGAAWRCSTPTRATCTKTFSRFAERLTQLLPEPLRVCYFLNSGSEANELALRLARAHTGREDMIVLEHAYHGNTNTLIDISPYKFNGPGGRGRKPWVHVAPIADDYRGPYRRGEADAGAKYAAHVAEILERGARTGRGLAAFIAETLPSVAGQIVFPPDYLAEVYRLVRAAGGVCIADEVQVGFGRLGTHFWGFETQGVVPDIVVLGKPIGNAFPLAAVVTTQEIAASFANGMEFFSTFGGNPVACAAGLAVLDVVGRSACRERALRVGDHWMARLKNAERAPCADRRRPRLRIVPGNRPCS